MFNSGRFSLAIIGIALTSLIVGCNASGINTYEEPGLQSLVSPGKKVSAQLLLSDTGTLNYTVHYNGRSVQVDSALGITVDGVDLGKGVTLGKPKKSVVDEQYPSRGHDKEAHNHYVNWRFPVNHQASGKYYELEFRLYDDGVAYRYIVPGKGVQHVAGESSSWTMPANSKVWFFERDSDWKLMSYAGWWTSADIEQMPTISKQGPVQGTPLVFELPSAGGYAVVTKAALYNYSGMRLKAVGNNTFSADFTEGDKGFDVLGTITTPWRVTMLANDLNSLVNSDLIENLNPAPDASLFANTDYIQPGRSVWSWMSMRLGTIADQKDFVDYAAELGFEYSIIDDGWKDWPNPWQTLSTITAQGEQKGVKVWVWVDSKDIKDPANDYQKMREYLDKVKAAGACGVKTDFMNSEAKDLIDFEINFLEKSAQRQLLVNFHGSHSSTGEARTYPNELTREGIRGVEVNVHRNGHLPPSHNAALPFTRFLVGHADYTPLYFTNPGPTTFAHQLATPIAFLSPVQIYADHPKVLQNNPDINPALNVIKAIPTTWDETRVLPGSDIGKLAGFARRSGEQWFVGILNDEFATHYELDLSFLGEGQYQVELVEDDDQAPLVNLKGLNKLTEGKLASFTEAIPYKVSSKLISKSETLAVKMAAGGGFVAVFTPK